MVKTTGKIGKFGLIASIVVIAMTLVLEILSRHQCSNDSRKIKNPCFDLLEKYQGEVDITDTLEIYVTEALKTPPDKITDEEIEEIVQKKTIVVDRSEINGANGIYCYKLNFISSDLPDAAKNYVKTHEALHFLGKSNETKVNYIAARKEPLGFIQTAGYSVFLSVRDINLHNLHCKLGTLWNTFKVYFLNASTHLD